MELTYYSDSERRETKGSINITQITKVSPITGKSKDHVFSIEISDGKKLVMKAADARIKSIWLAKLLEASSKGGSITHRHTHIHTHYLALPKAVSFGGQLKMICTWTYTDLVTVLLVYS